MGTPLFAVDGVDVAGLVAQHLGPRVLPAVLLRPGSKAARDPNNLTAAPQPGPPTSYGARGWTEDFKPADVDGNLIKAGDRIVYLLGDTIQGGLVPEGGVDKDQVTIEGSTWNVYRVLGRDPAGAAYKLQVRKP